MNSLRAGPAGEAGSPGSASAVGFASPAAAVSAVGFGSPGSPVGYTVTAATASASAAFAASAASPELPAAGAALPHAATAAAAAAAHIGPLAAQVSGILGTYCRILVGDARFRADVLLRVTEVVLRWMAARPTSVALYGRRAWNAHLAEPALAEATTDIDVLALVGGGRRFEMLRYSLLAALHAHCPDLSPIMHAYTKPHQDGRGTTMTVEIGGVPLVDLSARDRPDDFCIGPPDPEPAPGPHLVMRVLEAAPGQACAVAVLRRRLMARMLRAEIRARIWRADRAARDLVRYELYDTMGWFLPDDPPLALAAASLAATPALHLTHVHNGGPWEAYGFANEAAEDAAEAAQRAREADEAAQAAQAAQAAETAQRAREADEAAQAAQAAETAQRAREADEAAQAAQAAEAAQRARDADEAAQAAEAAEADQRAREDLRTAAGASPELARTSTATQTEDDDGASLSSGGSSSGHTSRPPSSAGGSEAPHAAALLLAAAAASRKITTRIQLDLLRRHLRKARTLDECRRCAGLFVYQKDDPLHRLLAKVMAAAHVGEVCRIVNDSEAHDEEELLAPTSGEEAECDRASVSSGDSGSGAHACAVG